MRRRSALGCGCALLLLLLVSSPFFGTARSARLLRLLGRRQQQAEPTEQLWGGPCHGRSLEQGVSEGDCTQSSSSVSSVRVSPGPGLIPLPQYPTLPVGYLPRYLPKQEVEQQRYIFDMVTIAQRPPPYAMRGNLYVEGAKTHVEYARIHGYDCHISSDKWPGPPRAPSWHKVDAVRHSVLHMLMYKLPALPPGREGWIWWADSDIFIKNMSVRLEDIIDQWGQDEEVQVIITRDCLTINGGSMMYRASEWTLGFLDKVASLRDSKLYDPAKYYSTWEQGAINYLAENDPDVRRHMRIIPGRVFNSYAAHRVSPCDMIYQPGDFVIHYSGAFGRAEYYTNGSLVKRPYTRLFRFVSSFFQNNVSRSMPE